MIEVLLKHGADTNAVIEYYKYTPLSLALKKSKSMMKNIFLTTLIQSKWNEIKINLIWTDNLKLAELLFEHGANVDYKTLYDVCSKGIRIFLN